MLRRTVIKGVAAGAGLAAAWPAGAQKARQGRWLRLETDNFVVFSAGSEDRTRKELAALEGFHKLLVKLIPRKQPSALKLPLYLTGNDRDLDATAPGSGDSVYGFWQSSVEQIRAVSTLHRSVERQGSMPRNVRAMDARVVLLHEYTHHYVMANSRVTYPAWYNEGIAEFLSTADFEDDGVVVGKFTAARATWLVESGWLGINTFLTANPGELSGYQNAQFYAQAWLAAHYLSTKSDRAVGFDKYITALHEGADPIAAFEPAFGITPQAFDSELRDYKSDAIKQGKVAGITADPSIAIKAERLPLSADEMLMPLSYLRSIPPLKRAEKSVASIKAQHKKFETDTFAIRARALAEIWYGDLGEARKLLNGLLVADAQNAETQHLSGLCDLRAAYATNDASLFKRARLGFATAHRIDGTRASSLFRYAECGVREQGGRIDQHNADVLSMVYQLAPQVDAYAQALAMALMQRKNFQEAIAVLKPQVANSHDKDGAFAKKLVSEAKAEKEPEFVWPESAAKLREDG